MSTRQFVGIQILYWTARLQFFENGIRKHNSLVEEKHKTQIDRRYEHHRPSCLPKMEYENIFCWKFEDRFVDDIDTCNCYYRCSLVRYKEEVKREKKEEADRPFAKRPLSPTEKERKAVRTTKFIKKKKKSEAKKTSDDVDSGKQPTLFDFYNSNNSKSNRRRS
jgi:hypothetical protein